VRILYYAIELHSGDVMMLSSDGLHGVVENREIEHILGDPATSLEAKSRALIAAAHAGGSPDNVTVLLIRVAGKDAGEEKHDDE